MKLGSRPQRRLLTVAAVLTAGAVLTSAGCSTDRNSAAAAGAASGAGSASTSAGNSVGAVAGTPGTSTGTGTTTSAQPSSAAPTGVPVGAAPTRPAAGPVPKPPAATTPVPPASSASPLEQPKQPAAPPPPPPVPASSLPNAAAADWQPMGGLAAMTVPAARDIGIGECAGVHGAVAWHEQGYVSAQHTPAQEDVFGFGDTATATKAFQDIAAGLDSCAAPSRALQQKNGTAVDATVVTTATANQAQAWSRQWTGVAGQSAAGPQTNHYYLLQRGATVILAAFTEFGAAPANRYDTSGDPAVLTMLAAHAGS